MIQATAPTKAPKDRSVSARQRETLELIEQFTQRTGYSPSFRDLAAALGVHVHCVTNFINRLEERGLIVRAIGWGERSRSPRADAKS